MTPVTARPGNAPGVLQMRLMGDEQTVSGLADVLDQMDSVEVLTRSGPLPNRRDPGVRVHLTVRLTREGESSGN